MLIEFESWLRTPLGTVCLTLLGLSIGSFLNVVIVRLPIMLSQADRKYMLAEFHISSQGGPNFNLVTPRSQCPTCSVTIDWQHNIPILSWLMLRGRCAYCSQPISVQYPVVEATSAIFVLHLFSRHGLSIDFALFTFFYCGMMCLVVIDWRHRLIPDSISLPLIGCGLLLSVLPSSSASYISSTDAIFGCLAAYALFWVLNLCYRTLTSREGIGAGDFRLAAAIGAWFGWALLPWILLVSAIGGLAYGLILLTQKEYDRHVGVQFGSFLGFAAIAFSLLRDFNLLPYFMTL